MENSTPPEDPKITLQRQKFKLWNKLEQIAREIAALDGADPKEIRIFLTKYDQMMVVKASRCGEKMNSRTKTWITMPSDPDGKEIPF